MKKHLILFTFLSAIFTANIFSQASIDPSHVFYSNVERWEIMGIISQQPPLRPYNLNVIEGILTQVIQSDNEKESQTAQELYDEIFNVKPKLKFQTEANVKFEDDDLKKQLVILPGVDGDYSFSDLVSLGYRADIAVTNNRSTDSLPYFSPQSYFFHDPAKIKSLKLCLEIDSGISIGNENLYAQMGINRNSFGSFYDNSAVLSPDAKHTANFSFVWRNDWLSFTHAMIGLSASSSVDDDLFPQKFLAINSLNADLFDWLSASYYEVMIYGGRFEPAYLIPAPFMVTQGISGYDDNLLMGLSFDIKPFKNFVWNNNFFIDDLGVNELVKFNFDTKIRGAFQTAVKYIPASISWIDMLSVNYTLITPYMYSHSQTIADPLTGKAILGSLSAINYQQYTTAAAPLGLSLPPNSDSVSISATFTPINRLKIDLNLSYTRHANVNESITLDEAVAYLNSPEGYLATDGTINNHPHFLPEGDASKEGEYLDSAWDHLLLLSQPTKMQIFRADIDAEYSIARTQFGAFSFTLGYSFEYINNYGVDKDIYPGTGGGKTKEDAKKALTEWRNNLTDVYANYLRFGFKYVW